MTAPPTKTDRPPHRWDARWIWSNDDEQIENSFYYFRTDFNTDGLEELKLRITADTKYRLFVNGDFVGEGPPRSQPFHKYYDVYDVGPSLTAGPNCIGVVVHNTGNMEDSRGGLLIEGIANGETVVASDENWQVTRAEAWRQDTFAVEHNRQAPHQEHYDARRAPGEWTDPGFATEDWNRPTVLEGRTSDRPPAVGPWSRLLERDIPRMETERVRPTAIEDTYESLAIANRFRDEDLSIGLSTNGTPIENARIDGIDHLHEDNSGTVIQNSTDHRDDPTVDGVYDPCIVIDFGQVITGYVELELNGPAGGTVDIGYAERLIDGEFNNALECQFADRYVMEEGEQQFRAFSWRAFRYLKLRFRECFEPVQIEDVRVMTTQYPFEERGGFESTDETLEDVFDISRRTIRLCCHEAIMDTPWREQAQWLGDVAAGTLGGIYSCFGDTALPEKFLLQSAANQQVTGLLPNVTNDVSHEWQNSLCDYSLWWIIALHEHYEYTGNEEWIHRYYPHVQKIVQAFEPYLDEHGLLANVPYLPLMDWADLDRRGEFAPLNALFYGALGTVETMARIKGDEYTRDNVRTMRRDIEQCFEDQFYDPERGCIVDANVNGDRSEAVSEHANLAAVRWELVDDSTAESIIEEFYDAESISYTEAQPFFTTVVLQALDVADRFDLALDVVRSRWGDRMVARGATSTYEEWGINGSWRDGEYRGFLRSLSHAWSAHPAEFLTRNLVGFEVLEPGCDAVRIDPHDVGFEYEVSLPTPHGTIEVAKTDTDVDVSAPDTVRVERNR